MNKNPEQKEEEKKATETEKSEKEEEKTQNAESSSAEDVLNKEIEHLKTELETQKDILLRTTAEYDNYRKRTSREKASIYNDAAIDVLSKILPVADNLERALSQPECTVEDLRKGVEMVYTQLTESLEKLGVTSMGEVGETFNPDLHNAVSHIESEDLEENVIAAVFQKGYKIGDRIVRHAMVQVAN